MALGSPTPPGSPGALPGAPALPSPPTLPPIPIPPSGTGVVTAQARGPLVSRVDYSPTATASGGFLATAPASNLLIPQPQLTAIAPGGSVSFTVTLASVASIDLIYFANLIADVSATISVSAGTATARGANPDRRPALAFSILLSPVVGGFDSVINARRTAVADCDEFPNLGKLEEIEMALAKCASWGVKFLLAVQDITQLNGIYGLGHSIIANTHTRAYFPTNDLATAKTLSESTGTMTAQTPHTTIMGRRFGLLSQVTKSIQPTSRPLMTPGEILAMRAAVKDDAGHITEPGDVLLFLMGQRPLKAQQILYFLDPDFAARAQTPIEPPALPAPVPPLQLPWIPAMPSP